MNLAEVLEELHRLGDPAAVKAKMRYAIYAKDSLGITHKQLDVLVKKIGRDDKLAIALFDSGLYEGRLLCGRLFTPQNLTDELLGKWVVTFENWEMCDTFCMKLIGRTKWALPKAIEWSAQEPEFVKRAGFVCMVMVAMADKTAEDDTIRQFFPMLLRDANDGRQFVKKAINWALRTIGKRNSVLHGEAMQWAQKIHELGSSSAKWIATDAMRKLNVPSIKLRNLPKN